MITIWVLVVSASILIAIAIKNCDVRWKRDEIDKQMGSWWEHIRFELFGETNLFVWLAVFSIYGWIVIIVIALRFIIKYW